MHGKCMHNIFIDMLTLSLLANCLISMVPMFRRCLYVCAVCLCLCQPLWGCRQREAAGDPAPYWGELAAQSAGSHTPLTPQGSACVCHPLQLKLFSPMRLETSASDTYNVINIWRNQTRRAAEKLPSHSSCSCAQRCLTQQLWPGAPRLSNTLNRLLGKECLCNSCLCSVFASCSVSWSWNRQQYTESSFCVKFLLTAPIQRNCMWQGKQLSGLLHHGT